MKVNLDLTAIAAENLISDELHNNVGSAAFNLEHDFFYGDTELEIWTGAGKTGTQLIENTDYTLAGIDANFTARAGRNIYTTVTIDNVTYQTGDIYFTYQAAADYVDADDRYKIVRVSGQYWELTSGGGFEVYTTDTGGSSVKIDTLGGLDIDTDAGITINDDSGASIVIIDTGEITITSADTIDASLVAGTTGTASVISASGIVQLEATASTDLDAIKLNAIAGGIDVDSVLGVHVKDLYGGVGTGNGITLLADNDNASGTGGDVTITTTATSGTAGNIVIGSAVALTFNDQYTTAAIPFSETGKTGLDTTATSIVGAINELVAVGSSLDDAYNSSSAITVDTTDVDWVLSASRDFRIYDATDADKFVVTNGTGVDSIKIDTSGGVDIDANVASVITVTDANLTLETITSGTLAINSAGAIDIDGAAASVITVTDANLTIDTVTSGDIIVNSAGTGATAINVQTGSTARIKIANTGDTVFYGTATVDGALPVITLDQADVDEPFLKVIGDAASADLSRNLIDTGDVTTPTIVGYLKIEILDDGDQVTDGDYFVPFYSLV